MESRLRQETGWLGATKTPFSRNRRLLLIEIFSLCLKNDFNGVSSVDTSHSEAVEMKEPVRNDCVCYVENLFLLAAACFVGRIMKPIVRIFCSSVAGSLKPDIT